MSISRENLWNYESQFDNFQLFNILSNTVLFQPLIDFTEIRPSQNQEKINFMKGFSGAQQCINSLRLLSNQYTHTREIKEEKEKDSQDQNFKFFCMFQKNQRSNQRRFSMMPFSNKLGKGQKTELPLDQPNKLIVINHKRMIVAVQKKCITLYRIHNQHLILKDFDSIGIGSKLILVDLQYLKYKGKDYLLVFGNQKEQVKSQFKCLVYQVKEEKLRFIKKAILMEKENYKPIILFDHYSDKEHLEEMFCLLLGGFEDYQHQHYHFGAYQIHLHLLIQQYIEYPHQLTHEIPFNKKNTITTGKALKITKDISSDVYWLLFCTEYQTVTKLQLNFGKHDDQFLLTSVDLDTKSLKIRDERTGELEEIYYSQNTVYLMRIPENCFEARRRIPYRIYWCDGKMQRIRHRPLQQLITVFVQQ